MKKLKLIFLLPFLIFGTQSLAAEDIPLPELKKAIMGEFKNFPIQLDTETRLDNVEVGYNEILYYNVLVNYDYSQINFPVFRTSLRQGLTKTYCIGPALEVIRKANVALMHLYYDKNGELVGTIKTDSSVCKN